MGDLRHRLNQKYPTEVLAVLVTVLGITVSGLVGGGGDMRVLAASISPLNLLGGQSVVVNCNGRQLTVSRQNSKQVTLNCLANPTPVPTVVPTGVVVTSSPTMIPAAMTPTTMPTMPGTSMGGESMALMAWKVGGKNAPNPKYDKCDDGTDVVAAHNTFFVLGPDGKKYPTWHPTVVVNPVTKVGKCYFGHEHGRDPKGYAFWDEVRKHFAFDANSNGVIDSSELVSSGVPFGYVNEQMDLMAAGVMRHEDHVGHKIEFANGEGDIGEGTDPFDSSKTGGVVVPVKNPSGNPKWLPSGVRCYFFQKVHQGVSTPDALTNNLHEVVIHANCTSTLAQFPSSTSLLSGMIAFGAPGEFTKFCGDDRFQTISLGKTAANQNWPGTTGVGMRNITTRDCVEKTMLVPAGQFSSFPYEIWDGGLNIRTAQGRVIASNGGGWEVLDAIRYYNPNSANKISYIADVCYEVLGDRKTRGGACDDMTNYGRTLGITWDDTRSGFKGVHRGQYINAHTLNNAGGSSVWYTDAFGNNAQASYFPGSVKQLISPVKANLDGLNVDPRIIQRRFETDYSFIHAPN